MKFVQQHEDKLYVLFRVLVGLLFFQHGAQKLLGWFGGTAQPLLSQMGVAGVIELVGGLCIALGLFTRIAALLSGLQMLVAYFMVHAPNALAPIENSGELALVYFAAFTVLVAQGNGRFNLESKLLGKETF